MQQEQAGLVEGEEAVSEGTSNCSRVKEGMQGPTNGRSFDYTEYRHYFKLHNGTDVIANVPGLRVQMVTIQGLLKKHDVIVEDIEHQRDNNCSQATSISRGLNKVPGWNNRLEVYVEKNTGGSVSKVKLMLSCTFQPCQ